MAENDSARDRNSKCTGNIGKAEHNNSKKK